MSVQFVKNQLCHEEYVNKSLHPPRWPGSGHPPVAESVEPTSVYVVAEVASVVNLFWLAGRVVGMAILPSIL